MVGDSAEKEIDILNPKDFVEREGRLMKPFPASPYFPQRI